MPRPVQISRFTVAQRAAKRIFHYDRFLPPDVLPMLCRLLPIHRPTNLTVRSDAIR